MGQLLLELLLLLSIAHLAHRIPKVPGVVAFAGASLALWAEVAQRQLWELLLDVLRRVFLSPSPEMSIHYIRGFRQGYKAPLLGNVRHHPALPPGSASLENHHPNGH